MTGKGSLYTVDLCFLNRDVDYDNYDKAIH